MNISLLSLYFYFVFIVASTIVAAIKYQQILATATYEVKFGFDTFVFLSFMLYCFALSPIMINSSNNSEKCMVDVYSCMVLSTIGMGILCSRIAIGTVIYLSFGPYNRSVDIFRIAIFNRIIHRLTDLNNSWQRLNRLQFSLSLMFYIILSGTISLIIYSLMQLFLFAVGFNRPAHLLIYIIYVILIITGTSILILKRLRDIGRPSWHLCLILIPFATFFYAIYLVLKKADDTNNPLWYLCFLLPPGPLPAGYVMYFIASLFFKKSVVHVGLSG